MSVAHLLIAIGHEIGQIDERPRFSAWAISRVHSPYRPEPRSTRPSFQILRTVSESRIGLGPFAFDVGDHLAEIPAEGMHDFVLLGDEVVDFLVSSPSPGSEPRAIVRC